MIILFGAEKGGTGKTTLAVNFAVMLGLSGRDVLLVDTDKQGSASFWSNTRDESGIIPRIPCVQSFGKSLAKNILDFSQRYEDVVIDAGGRDSMELRYSLGVADSIIIPIQPTQFDLMTLGQMSKLVEQAQVLNPSMVAYVVINRASTNPAVTDTQEAIELISDINILTLCKSVLRERVSYQRSVREGLSVIESTQPDNKAITEINGLFQEIYDVTETEAAETRCGFSSVR